MWLPISLGVRLNPQLAVALDRLSVDIAFHRVHKGGGPPENALAGSRLDDALRDFAIAFEGSSDRIGAASLNHNFRHTPLSFEPITYSTSALFEAASRGAAFAYRIGRLLEERLGLRSELPPAGTAAECDAGLAMRIGQLTAQTGELLCSGDLAMVVLVHRMLLHAQALCVLLARFRPFRAPADPELLTAAPVLTEPLTR